jgi:hypothetical protein
MRINKQDLEPHHGMREEGEPAGGHGRAGGGDRLPRIQVVRAELRRGTGGGSGDGITREEYQRE